ncbi:beta-galactosidase [Aspergillus costaricaensis CBS 115574]|uniref:Beta-galactosidase n=1 Tax=Aspergillus costaricaensis CBS 115574 TaxID=1448317 RepID=A0ACD1IFC1_9EURO|nr:beta-galactosidase [Aspergillus costaricaensis CBS 115574]RAK88787.1 beta-galactosidase [Aspergillus costaricaensis CBS 115574]
MKASFLLSVGLAAKACLGLVTAPKYVRQENTTGSSLQDIVTWDEYSIRVHGERILLLSGEFHPFRLPSPGLWLDVFQKVRALGFSAVSFYVDWALLEGERGSIRADGVFALEDFFQAATEAGLYLTARPGPYINAEVSGGGFPGWLERVQGRLKTTDQGYLGAITPYMQAIGRIIAKAQITNGGPVILFQPENEYTACVQDVGYTQINNYSMPDYNSSCLQKDYMAYVEDQYRKAGVVVPFIVNDAEPMGNFAPGTGVGAVDIYSFDDYPMHWSTAPSNPSNWSSVVNPLLSYNETVHEEQSLTTPFSISEFQGGVPDGWGGVGVDTSAAYIGPEFARIFYKINYGFRTAIQNLYMIFGGTNWGNLGHPGGYTSYDVGAAIAEDREVIREKYSELKLQSNFLQASPAYLESHPENGSYGIYTDTTSLAVTRLAGNPTNFYVVRHGELTSQESTSYKLRVNTTAGSLTIPQLGGTLSLNGRDSKIHLVDYNVGNLSLIYSSAELFTWKQTGSKSVVVLYGGEDELHEFAVPANIGKPTSIEGDDLQIQQINSTTVIQWAVQPSRRVVHFGNTLEVHLLWRNEAYNYWVLDLPVPGAIGRHVSQSHANRSVIVKAGYLLRTAELTGTSLYLTGDINTTTTLELISAPQPVTSIFFNNQSVQTSVTSGRLTGTLTYQKPNINLPDLTTLDWHYLNTLPEVRNSTYNDDLWTPCTHITTANPRNLTTPTSLYASDYGYNGGSLLYRGTFTATGNETSLYLLTEGGYAYGYSIWLNNTFLASWLGDPLYMFSNQTVTFPSSLTPGATYTLTILIDHLGNDENFPANGEFMKDPRGILDYTLHGRDDKSAISWKITGNFGGEHYADLTRGPLNEGAFFAERKGYHLPGAPVEKWTKRSPFEGLPEDEAPGVGFFATIFDLNVPDGYDVPFSVVFENSTTVGDGSEPARFRSELFVNGWQFGKYVNHIGPQFSFPVPEGILDYNGSNYLAVTIWAMDESSFKLDGLRLQANAVLQSGYRKPSLVEGEVYKERAGSY